ncbi:MAG: flagellar biosynthetic protein FliO [Planctomycetes bacterium]|nr:flagellar biosynthetic protein FliO [Planctomycetota bacterium]
MADPAHVSIDWIRLFVTLAACGGGALLLVWLRRRQVKSDPSLLAVEDRLRLGPRHQVFALRVGNKTLLLGATTEHLVLLSTVERPEPTDAADESEDPESKLSAPSPFARALEASQVGAA